MQPAYDVMSFALQLMPPSDANDFGDNFMQAVATAKEAERVVQLFVMEEEED